MVQEEKKQSNALAKEVSVTAAGTIVGIALGGPVGAFVGAVSVPIIKEYSERYLKKRNERALNIIQNATRLAQVSEESLLTELDYESSELLFSILRKSIESNPALDDLFTVLISKIIEERKTDLDRVIVMAHSVQGISLVHFKLLNIIFNSQNHQLSSSEIAEKIRIPEIELRYIVRDLELRGMIIDIGSEDTVIWQLRELGEAICKYSLKGKKND